MQVVQRLTSVNLDSKTDLVEISHNLRINDF